ncbi:MAG: ATP-binding protein [Crenarchaeota archaeon]|nr:ATP-binding protein [Thermoproteota archaeon]
MIKLVDELYVENFLAITPEPIYNTENRNIKFHDKITVLYGPNSTGKTSIIYALLSLLETVYGSYHEDIIKVKLNDLLNLANNPKHRVSIKGRIGVFTEYIEVEKSVNERKSLISIEEKLSIIEENLKVYSKYVDRVLDKYVPLTLPGKQEVTNSILYLTKEILDTYEDVIDNNLKEKIKRINELTSRNVNCKYLNYKTEILLKDIINVYDSTCKIDVYSLFKEVLVKYIYPLPKHIIIENIKNLIVKGLINGTRDLITELNRYVDFITCCIINDIELISKEETFIINLIIDEKTIELEKLSTGFLNIINIALQLYQLKRIRKQLSEIFNIELPKSLVILDTVEFNIHVDWLYHLLELLLREEDFQIIVETHSGLVLSYSVRKNLKTYYIDNKNNKTMITEISEDNLYEAELFEKEKETLMEII